MRSIDKQKNLQTLQQFNLLLQKQLPVSQRLIDEVNQSAGVITDLQSYYTFFQTLLLSADAYGLQQVSQISASIIRQLMQVKSDCFSDVQKQRVSYLHDKLHKTITAAKIRGCDKEANEPMVHFYGLSSHDIDSVLKQIRGHATPYRTLKQLDEITSLSESDIFVFRLTEDEIEQQHYKTIFAVKKIQSSQLIYLAKKADENLSLTLGGFGLENFFIWPNDQLFFTRHFYNVYHNACKEAVPYQICLVGCNEEINHLSALMASFGIHVYLVETPKEALKLARQTEFDAFVIEESCLQHETSALVSAIRQISKLKLVPIFHLRKTEMEGRSFSIGHQYDQDVILTLDGINLNTLCLEVFSRLSHERKLNTLTLNASEAVQQQSDWKTGLDVHNMMSITDRQGRIVEVNDNFCRVSGYDREELLGQNHRIINSGFHPRGFFQEMWQSISQGKIWQGEVCNRAKDGTLYWVESSVFPVLNALGEPEKFISIRTDVTHLKTIEERLLEVQSLAKLGNWQADMKTGALEWSDTIFEIFGFDKQNFKPCVEAFKNAIHPEDVELVEQCEKKAQETGLHDVVHRIVRPDGEIRYVHELARAFKDKSGNLVRLAGSVQDVTDMKRVEEALKNSESRLNVSQNFANIGTWDYNTQTGELYWSERISPLFGGPMQEMETTYENFVNALHPEDRQNVLDAVTDCIENNAKYDIEHRVIWEDGTVRWLLERGNVLRDKNGVALNMLGVVQDITLRKEAEQELFLARQRAERSDQAKSNFLSQMSHELRTPLNAIIGFSQLIQMSTKSELEKKQVGNILNAGEHLLSLINDILDLSKVESGQMEFSIENICLNDVINSAFQMTDFYALEHNVQLSIPESSGMSITVLADFMRLKQVFINLISNAVKYNKAEGQVAIKCEQDGVFAFIHFEDTGIGVSEDMLDQLFMPFNRLNQEQSGIEGTGIGLAITKRFMDEMAGDISVTSVYGQGSTFTVKIPLAQKSSSVVERVSAPIAPQKIKAAIKILCIDDNPQALRLMSQQLSEIDSHIKFLASPTAKAGIAIARREIPDLIFVDMDISDMLSFDLLAELRQVSELKECRIVALNSAEIPTDFDTIALSTFDHYLTKPYKVSDIISEIERGQS